MEISRHSHKLPESFTHVHETSYEIMYCICGSYTFHYGRPKTDGSVDVRIIRPKTMIFLPKGLPHGTGSVQYPYERYFIQFGDRTMEQIRGESTVLPVLTRDGEGGRGDLKPCFWDVSAVSDRLERIMELMYDVQFSLDMDEHWKRMNLTSLLGMLFCELYRGCRSFFDRSLARYTPPVQAAKSYIDEHYDQPVTIGELARECFLSANYLSKSFHEQVGMSPQQYLSQKRLAMGKKMLCSTQLPIQAVSMRSGFSDVNYFIQKFKAAYGMTPRKYRKTVAEREEGD